jgi:phospholipid/cholesterol/gamma-HCH transport system substrate-binding protein
MANNRQAKVGAFVFIGFLVFSTIIFMIGNSRRAFSRKVEYYASFSDVQGLKPGAPVLLGGITIGHVTDVRHGPNQNDDRLYVTMDIVRTESVRVRSDSVVKVANKGLLGDKMLEMTPGTPGTAPLPPKSTLKTEDPTDYGNLMNKAGEMVEKTSSILSNVEKATNTLAQPQVRQDVEKSLASISIILTNISNSSGYVGKLINDPKEAERLSDTINNLNQAAVRLNHTISRVDHIVARVEHGPGAVHDLIYTNKGSAALDNIGGAAHQLDLTLKGVREGDGLAKGVLFGDPQQKQILANLQQTTQDLKLIMHDMRQGKGTLGAFLTDPSIYEDVKRIVGDVERNDVLRALVRYSIKHDQRAPKVKVKPAPKKE